MRRRPNFCDFRDKNDVFKLKNQKNPCYCCSKSLTFTIVVQKPYCCSVVTVNNKNIVQRLTLRCSTNKFVVPILRVGISPLVPLNGVTSHIIWKRQHCAIL